MGKRVTNEAVARQMAGVCTGFVVKKVFKTKVADDRLSTHTKVVSQKFMAREAAVVFRDLAEKDNREHPNADEIDVSFFVSDVMGKDELPRNL